MQRVQVELPYDAKNAAQVALYSTPVRPPARPLTYDLLLHTAQIFLASGFLVLVFEMFAVPNITPRVGFKMSQRLGSIFEIPVYVLLPLLSNLNADGTFVTATSIILVFMCYVSANSVSACRCDRVLASTHT